MLIQVNKVLIFHTLYILRLKNETIILKKAVNRALNRSFVNREIIFNQRIYLNEAIVVAIKVCIYRLPVITDENMRAKE